MASSKRLAAPAPRDSQDVVARNERLIECTTWVLDQISRSLS
jgi:hypothetical protein